jgi:hypothetical protein
VRHLVMIASLGLLLAAPVQAQQPPVLPQAAPTATPMAQKPEDAARLFFLAIHQLDYSRAWQLLTQGSQARFLKIVAETEALTPAEQESLRKAFEQADIELQRGFWTSFRRSIGLSDWLKQTFTLDQQQGADVAWIKAMPANIRLQVRRENQEWRIAYTETFLDAAARPKPSPSPQEKR